MNYLAMCFGEQQPCGIDVTLMGEWFWSHAAQGLQWFAVLVGVFLFLSLVRLLFRWGLSIYDKKSPEVLFPTIDQSAEAATTTDHIQQ